MEDMETDSHAFLKVMEASFASLLPLVLKVAIQLGVVNILEAAEREQDGGDSSLSAMEIAARVEGRTASVEQTASLLIRILRILANHGLLNATSSRSGGIRYGLNQSSRVLVQPDSLACISRFLLLLEDPDALRSFSNAHDALLHGGIPFVMAHGMPLYTFMQQNQIFKQLFHGTMSAHSRLIMCKVLDTYEGLQTVHSLVDVGGGNGDCLSMIISRYPHIRGINLDLAYIIADAPSYAGVEHVIGDMFVEIPKADAIFMKWILHNWDDEHCLRLLKNCHKSLPPHGKIIALETLQPTILKGDANERLQCYFDFIMATSFGEAKQRTKEEIEDLSILAGFSKANMVNNVYGISIIEISK